MQKLTRYQHCKGLTSSVRSVSTNCLTGAQKLMDVIQSSEKLIDRQDIGAGVTRWRLPEGVAWMGLPEDPNLYERETWTGLLDMCISNMVEPTLKRNRGVAFGHVPGIGKSIFLNRLLIEFHKRFPEKPVLYYCRHFEEFIMFDWPF